MPTLEVPSTPQTPDQPSIVPDAPISPAVPDPGPEAPDTPSGPIAPEPDDPAPPRPDGPEVPPPDEGGRGGQPIGGVGGGNVRSVRRVPANGGW